MRYDPDAALNQAISEINALRARLAAVLALCDGHHRYGFLEFVAEVRAAARGEGDR